MINLNRTTYVVSVVLTALSLVANFGLVSGFSNSIGIREVARSPLSQISSTDTRVGGQNKLNLYNPAGSAGNGNRSSRKSVTSLGAAPPEITNWRVLKNGCVQGISKKHPTIADGDIITTSPLRAPNAVGPRMIVTTGSGSKYKLMEPLEKEKPGTFTVNKRMRSPRKSPSMNISGKIPLLDDWKLMDNDSVQGFVFNHPTIPDGQFITTSTLKTPRTASQKALVNTISGSKYRLGAPEGAPVEAAAAATPAAAPKKQSGGGGSGGLFGGFFGGSPAPAPAAPAARAAAPSKAAAPAAPTEKDLAKENRAKRVEATRKYALTGEPIGVDAQYLLAGSPMKSTSGKSVIYKAYRSDDDGLPVGDVEKDALTVKVSSNNQAIEREAGNYRKIAQSGINRGKFVELFEYLPQDRMNTRKGQCALVLERGEEDLKTYLARRRREGGLTGKELRDAAAAAVQCIQAAHNSGLVWTDMKTENFIVTKSGEFKGIDLESAMPIKGNPVDYSPEACPPEFAASFLAGDGPYFTLQPNYDIWSFGMMCYEMATGAGYFDNKTPLIITQTLAGMEEFEIPNDVELDGRMRSLIEDCLQVDPRKRPSTAQVLLHPYFLTTGIGPFSF